MFKILEDYCECFFFHAMMLYLIYNTLSACFIYRKRYLYGKEVSKVVKGLSMEYHNFETLPKKACDRLFSIAENGHLDYAYVIDELNLILKDGIK